MYLYRYCAFTYILCAHTKVHLYIIKPLFGILLLSVVQLMTSSPFIVDKLAGT